MFRALTILAAVVALAVTASPASAGTKPPPRQFGNVENIDPFVGMVRAKVLDVGGHNVGFIKDGTSNTIGARSVVTEKMSATHYVTLKPPGLQSTDHQI
jgi:hypothetical protein